MKNLVCHLQAEWDALLAGVSQRKILIDNHSFVPFAYSQLGTVHKKTISRYRRLPAQQQQQFLFHLRLLHRTRGHDTFSRSLLRSPSWDIVCDISGSSILSRCQLHHRATRDERVRVGPANDKNANRN